MISKERLENIIKTRETLYYINCCSGVGIIELEFLPNLNLDIYDNDVLRVFSYKDNIPFLTIPLNTLFKTKKEAELHLEFVGIKREEEFPYVSWEDFSGGLRIIEFVSFKHENIELSVLTISYETAYIQLFNSKTETMLFNKPATEENYYEALRLAKKLFLGEEV